MVSPLVSDAFCDFDGTHGYFTRQGGVSAGVYDSLNIGLGSDDVRDAVLQNRARVAAAMGVDADSLVLPYQVHSADAVIAHRQGAADRAKADAVVTSTPGVAVGVSTADCGPVLFADAKNRVVAAAHAGWRGALTGILEATLDLMEEQGGERAQTVAVLGPTISGGNYEVGPEFIDRFVDADAGNAGYFSPSGQTGHAYFDLPAYIVARLKAAGIGEAHDIGACTYADENRFYSYRRSVHRGEPDYGRLVSAIALTP
ncbi:MAG: peptidoglycan editing factor PgeF [Pseudomonadota bacterium]